MMLTLGRGSWPWCGISLPNTILKKYGAAVQKLNKPPKVAAFFASPFNNGTEGDLKTQECTAPS